MIYQLDVVSSANTLIPWVYIFRSLSIPQFRQVCDKPNFPVNPTDDLRQLAHDFAIAYDINLGNPVSEVASIDLLEGTSPTDHLRKRAQTLFANTFSYLERMGCAQSIYYWGRHTSDYHNHENGQQVDAWCSLLLKWAVLEQATHPISPEHELYSKDWDDVVARWTPVYTRVPPEPFRQLTLEPLALSAASRLTLRVMILQCEARLMNFETTLERILTSPKSAWEDFALRSGGSYIWMKGEGRFRIRLQEWNTIENELSADEMSIFEQWGLKDTYHKITLPLPNFTSEFPVKAT